MLKKTMDVFEVWMNMQGLMMLAAFVLWLLNGGKNDFGLIHNTAANMLVAVFCMLGIMVIGFILAIIGELLFWVRGLLKQEK